MLNIKIRAYQPADLDAVWQLFKTTVRVVNRRDYTSAQLSAWVGPETVLVREHWQKSLLAHVTVVAEYQNQLVGFADMTATGYLDRLYVHAAFQGCGIATQLLQRLETQVKVTSYQTYASLTARPFFEHRGYHVVRGHQVSRQGQVLRNWLMQKG